MNRCSPSHSPQVKKWARTASLPLSRLNGATFLALSKKYSLASTSKYQASAGPGVPEGAALGAGFLSEALGRVTVPAASRGAAPVAQPSPLGRKIVTSCTAAAPPLVTAYAPSAAATARGTL